jgi:hypothetical protein
MRGTLLWLTATACSFDYGAAGRDGAVDRDSAGSDGRGSDAGSGSDATLSSLRQKTITIIGAVTGTHADFPLWISLTDSDIAARARADGTDIHFVAGATDLDYQIQSWVKGTGVLEAWVRVPSLATGTQLAVRYGDITAAHAPDAPGTFAGYQAVWHLDDPLTNNTIADARNQANGTATGLAAADNVDGALGRAINFTDGNEQIAFTNALTGNTPHTISMWIDQRATASNDCIISLGNGAQDQARWFHSRYMAATIAVGFYANDYPANENIIGDNWTLLHWVYEGNNRMTRIYRGGAMVAGPFQHASGINTQGTAGRIGNADSAFGANMGINAALDELRIINVARSASWIAAEASNQTTPASFYSLGNEQTP